ncbi:MAG TPA: AAA family ATPase [Desulfuromonadales bacterium]|nr:AAA family ATPase [Desulfuromonadales bacterium]
MYNDHFGLKEAPFSIVPDPRYLYLSGAHREALAHLLYGLRGEGGFVLLTGEVGTGKTTICRCLLEQVPDKVQVALVLNPSLSVPELLATICDELGIAYPEGNASNKTFIDVLNRFLLDSHAKGMTTVLIVDEAQSLSADVLEQLRLLTNLETSSRKLLQIILIGQPELRDQLARNDLRQIAQRVTARYHLGPLGRADLADYLQHRLAVAGGRGQIFTPRAIATLYRASRGIPRLVNVLADRALLGAYVQGQPQVDGPTVRRAAGEVLDPRPSAFGARRWSLAGLLAAAVVLALLTRSPVPESPAGTAAATVQRVAVPPPPVEPTPGPTAAGLVALPTGGSEKRLADIDLLRLWGVEAGDGGELCSLAQSAGLECLQSAGSLHLLGLLDRPAILHLRTAGGEPFYATLVRLQGDRMELLIGGQRHNLLRREFEQHWLGEFSLLWRPLFPLPKALGRGDRGDAVKWLSRALPDGADSPGAATELFDLRLEQRVKQFQVRHGLLPDGIAGPMTLILLNQRLGAPGPHLAKSEREP